MGMTETFSRTPRSSGKTASATETVLWFCGNRFDVTMKETARWLRAIHACMSETHGKVQNIAASLPSKRACTTAASNDTRARQSRGWRPSQTPTGHSRRDENFLNAYYSMM
jgi:hypothetical protein